MYHEIAVSGVKQIYQKNDANSVVGLVVAVVVVVLKAARKLISSLTTKRGESNSLDS